jgi:hypothetical protein
MRAKKGRATRKTAPLRAPRSAKAGRPPQAVVSSGQVRRRQKTAHATLKKGGMLLEAERPPRTVWGAESPKVKKR